MYLLAVLAAVDRWCRLKSWCSACALYVVAVVSSYRSLCSSVLLQLVLIKLAQFECVVYLGAPNG